MEEYGIDSGLEFDDDVVVVVFMAATTCRTRLLLSAARMRQSTRLLSGLFNVVADAIFIVRICLSYMIINITLP